MAKLTFKQHSPYKNSDEEFVKVDYKRLYESQYPSEAKLNKTLEKKIFLILGMELIMPKVILRKALVKNVSLKMNLKK